MVSRLERWVEDARKFGFPEEAGKKAGVPEEFRQETVDDQLKDQTGSSELPDIKQIRTRLVDILSSVEYEPGKPILTSELAKKLHEEIGQRLGNEVKIEDLIIPSKSAGEYRNSIDKQGFEGYERVNKRVRAVYNTCLISFARNHYMTLGEIRDIELAARKDRNIDITRLAFAKTAFARPQPPEGQA